MSIEPSDLGGRPTLYEPGFADQVKGLARLGLAVTTRQLAAFFGVSERTIERWKAQFPEFCQAIREGRIHADCLVAEKLFERATGYEWIEEQAVIGKDVVYGDNGKKLRETEWVEVIQVLKKLPPDVRAQIFWLRCRQTGLWR